MYVKSTCQTCKKIGFYSKLCKTKSSNITAAMDATNICTIAVSVPEGLWLATTRVSIKGHRLNALLDLGSSEIFINKNVTLKFQIETSPLKEISMALTTMNTQTCGFCVVNLQINKAHYKCHSQSFKELV